MSHTNLNLAIGHNFPLIADIHVIPFVKIAFVPWSPMDDFKPHTIPRFYSGGRFQAGAQVVNMDKS